MQLKMIVNCLRLQMLTVIRVSEPANERTNCKANEWEKLQFASKQQERQQQHLNWVNRLQPSYDFVMWIK